MTSNIHLHISEFEGSFWSDLLIAFIGSFFGFGFALLIYYRQIREDRKRREWERVSNFYRLLIYYQELISSIVESFTKQVKLVDTFIIEQEKDTLDLKILHRIHSNDFSRIKQIDILGVFEAWGYFFREDINSISKYKNTNAALDFLEGTVEEISRIYESNTKDCYDRLMVIKSIIDHIPDALSSHGLTISNNLGEERWNNSSYIFLDKSIKKYQIFLQEKANIHKINEEFLKPLIQECLTTFKTEPYANEILNLCKKARTKLHDVSMEVENLVTELKKIESRSFKSLEILQQTRCNITKTTKPFADY
jgi:hypothetical protein